MIFLRTKCLANTFHNKYKVVSLSSSQKKISHLNRFVEGSRVLEQSPKTWIIDASAKKNAIRSYTAFGQLIGTIVAFQRIRNACCWRTHIMLNHFQELAVPIRLKLKIGFFGQTWKYIPAVFVESHYIAFIFNASYRSMITVLWSIDFIRLITRSAPTIQMFRTVVPQQTHTHFT